jgi:SAM-dependent methyltransferase
MLSQARQRQPPLHLVQGRAGHLPFARGCFDLIYCVNAIHHFDQPQRFIQAAFDGMRPGGLVAVIGSDPHADGHHWYVHDYFEGVLESDLARFPPHSQIQRWMEDVGFQDLERREIEHIHDEHRGRSVLEDPFLRKEATSQLTLLSQEAYQAGLDRIRSELEKADAMGQEMVFQADLSISLLLGLKPA